MRAGPVVVAIVLALAGPAAAGDDRAARAAKTAVAVRAEGAIAVDGRLDDPTWRRAVWIADFAQKEPDQDAPPTDRTEVAIAFDADALYVAARMELADPARLDDPITRRDETGAAERIIVSLDPYRSRRTAYSFAVTAAGVRADWIHTDDSERARDHSWNPVWRAAVRIEDHAWTAEMRIPFSQLRYPADPAPVWGINFNRFVPRTREDDFWIVVPKDRTGWASYFGELRGLDPLEPRLRLEVLPYLAGEVAIRSSARFADGDPFADELAPGGGLGVDLKIGLGPSLTLDATVNPDFGQVEADPAVVTLDAYEVTFPERRPFFVEGSPIFASQPRAYFYSRRIGAPPRITPEAEFVEAPPAARILGAAKLTGRIAPDVNLGALAAVTGPVELRTADAAGAIDEHRVAPLTGWGVLRLERDLGGASHAGGTITAVARETDDPFVAAALPRAAISGGVDLTLRLDDGAYEVFAAAGGSAVTGRPSAIGAIQTAPAHYFQRPDADHVGLDPDATRIAGWHADLRGARRAGAWRFDAGLGAESPGFELNELGTLHSADDIDAGASLSRVDTAPGRWLHRWSATVADAEAWNFGGVHTASVTSGVVELTLPSFLRITGDAALIRPTQSDDRTRGGPLMGEGLGVSGGIAVNSPGAGALHWGARAGAERFDTGEAGLSAGVRLSWLVVDELRLELSPSGRAFTESRQYVDAVAGTAGGAETFGVRYLFATLSYRELVAQVRAQVSLSPDLTIDAYAEPFATSARYHGFGELPAPRARAIRRYDQVRRSGGVVTVDDGGDVFSVADPDFGYLSLRSTVVLRWELRPGSVLYAVWQQDRARTDAVARGVAPAVIGDVFTAPGAHLQAVKLSYWWTP